MNAAASAAIVIGKLDMLQAILFEEDLAGELQTLRWNNDVTEEDGDVANMHFAHVAIKHNQLFILSMLKDLDIPIPEPKARLIVDAALSEHGNVLRLNVLTFFKAAGIDLENIFTGQVQGQDLLASELCQVLCAVHNSVEVLEEHPYMMQNVNQMLFSLAKAEPSMDRRTVKARKALFEYCLGNKFSELLNPQYFEKLDQGNQHMISVLKSLK